MVDKSSNPHRRIYPSTGSAHIQQTSTLALFNITYRYRGVHPLTIEAYNAVSRITLNTEVHVQNNIDKFNIKRIGNSTSAVGIFDEKGK